jgi:hypothetical protein
VKKYLLAFFITLSALGFFLSTPQQVLAADPPPKKIDFDKVNPLKIGGGTDVVGQSTASIVANDLNTPGKIISRALVFAFPIAGMILFLMIVWGGFEMLAGAAESKAQEAGKQRITAAVIGFLLLFASYWVAQLIQVLFKVQFLG